MLQHNIQGGRLLSSVIFLFFALMTVGVIFCATDSEYNLNQTIARGYISRNVIFFEIHDPTRLRPNAPVTVNEDGEVENAITLLEDGGYIVDATVEEEAEDPDFVLNNDFTEEGLTKIEIMLSSGGDNYLAAIHQGELRGCFYRGTITTPPLIRGRFLTEKECLSRDNLAVIGSDFIESTFKRNGKEYINYRDKEYEVIGVTGISNISSLDHLIITNLGSMSPEEQKQGRMYIDGNRPMKEVYSAMTELSPKLFGVGLDRVVTPQTLFDVASGGMYLKTYLKALSVLLFVFIYLSVVIQIYRQQNLKVAVMSIYGLSFARRFISVLGRILICSLTGLVLGLIADMILIKKQYFTLPFDLLYEYMGVFFVVGILMIGLMALIISIGMRKVNIGEVIRTV